jgi:tRNA(Ile)-lysidine synthase
LITLQWDSKFPSVSADKARDSRFNAIANFCAERGVKHVLLGHHAEDNIETLFIRLKGNSGIDGKTLLLSLR